MFVSAQPTTRTTMLHNICKYHTTFTPTILMHETKREKAMIVWFNSNENSTNEIPTKEQCDAILKDLKKADSVKHAAYAHFSEGLSAGFIIYFAE